MNSGTVGRSLECIHWVEGLLRGGTPQFCLFVTKLYVLTISAREKPSHHLVLNQLSSHALPGRSLSTNTRVSLASILASAECWNVLDHKEMEENASAKNRLAGGFEPLFKDDYTNLFFWVVAMRNAPRIGVFLSHMCHVPSKRWYDDQGDRNHQVL